jgi:ribosomal protein S18 acetylase RimI-like enzyme
VAASKSLDERTSISVMLRFAIPSDARAIAALHAASWQASYRGSLSDTYLDCNVVADREAVWEDRFDHPSPRQHVFVAYEEDFILGFACAYLNEDPVLGCLLDNIHVRQAARRRGLGSQLLQAVASLCASSAAGSGLYLSVLQNNREAQRFYHAHGAEEVGTEIWDAPDGHQLSCLRFAWPASRLPVGQLA